MHKQTFIYGSMEDIRAHGGRVEVEGLMSASKEEKAEWMMTVLNAHGYSTLDRDDKGLVRVYLQTATGYSRAQVARYIGVYQKSLSMTEKSGVQVKKFSMRMPLALTVALVLIFLTRSGADQSASLLNVLNTERSTINGAYLNSVALNNSEERTVIVRTVMRASDGSLVSTPLLAVHEQNVMAGGSVRAAETLIAPSRETLQTRVNQRKLARMRSLEDGRIATRPDVTTDKEAYPAYTNSTTHAAAGAAWDIPAAGSNGQILMIVNGKPVWHDFPYLEDIRTKAPHGSEMTRRAGGNRSGGAADSQPVTTTVVQQSTTTTAVAPSGWTDNSSIVFLTNGDANVGIGTNETSNKLEVVGSISGASLYITGSMSGAGLVDCDATSNKLVYDAGTGRFSCATDQTVGTGLSITTGDERYVQKQGSTMTGTLVIDLISGTVGLEVVETASASTLFANTSLRSSGSLVFEGVASGSSLYIATSFQGAGLTDCDVSNSTLRWDSTTGRFSCGNIPATSPEVGTLSFSGAVYRLAESRYINTSGDTMTGVLVVNITGGNRNTVGLNIINTVSGAVIHAEKTLSTSGTLVFEGAASGSTLYVATSINGAGLVDCDIAGTSKLLWDATTGRFSCGADTDTNTTYTAGRGLGLNGTSFSLNDTITGSLLRFTTVSGSTLYAKNSLATSGSLVFEGAASGSSLWVSTFEGAGLTDCDAAGQTLNWDAATRKFTCGTDADTDTNTTYTAGKGLTLNGTSFSLNDALTGSLLRFTTISGSSLYAKNSLSTSGSLVFEGAASGSTLYVATSINGAGLTDCDLSISVLRWDASTGRFSCGNIAATAPEVGTTSFTGAVLRIADDRYINDNGDTMTGSLIINILNGLRNTIGLNVVNSISGAVLHGEKSVTSSGTLVFEGSASGSSIWVSTFSGAGLTDCDLSTSKVVYDSATERFSCATDLNTGSTYTAGRGLSLNGTSFSLNSVITGAIVRFNTISGSTLYGKNSISSSGTLVWEGAASGSSLYIATSINGAGLVDCDIAGTSKLLWDSTTGRFTCGTDTDTNTTYTAGKGLTLNGTGFSLNDVLTGSLVRVTTLSGSTVFAKNTLSTSGSLVFEGSASGSSLYIASSFQGAGLTDCDIAGTSKLLWDATTGRFSCGADTDTNTTYTAGRGLGLNGTSFSLNDTITGSLIRFTTVSGSTLYAKNSLATSGSLIFEGSASGSSLWVSTFEGAGLTDCDLSTNVLRWDATLRRFSCGTISSTSGASTGSVLTIGDDRYVRTAGDTMTGALTINVTGGSNNTVGLNVLNTISGAVIRAEKTLASSGTLNVEGDASIRNINITTGMIYSSSSLLRFIAGGSSTSTRAFIELENSGGVDIYGPTDSVQDIVLDNRDNGGHILLRGGNVGVDTNAPGSKLSVSGAMIIGTSIGSAAADAGLALEIIGTASGRVIRAQNTLASSGTLAWEGAASGSSLWVSTFEGAGLTDCDAAGQTLNWDETTKRFVCGADESAGSGMDQNSADARYVRKAGDTMTGKLTIDLSSGYLGLNVLNTISGAYIHAEKGITSSGAIVSNSGYLLTNVRNQVIRMQSGSATGKTLSILGADSTANKGGDLVLRAGNGLYTSPLLHQGPNSPDFTQSAGGGTIDWQNTDNVLASDDSYTTVSLDDCQFNCFPTSDNLFVNDFDFAVPLGATIQGIQVDIERKFSQCVTGTTARDSLIQLDKTGQGSSNRASSTAWTCSDTIATYGGPDDLWGLSWVPSDVNASTLGLFVAVESLGSTLGDAMIDSIAVTVYYSTTSSLGTPAGSVTIQAGTGSSPRIVLGTKYAHTVVLAGSGGVVGVGTSLPKATLDVAGSMSGTVLTLSNMRNCTLKTSATGAVICGTDGGNTYTAGRGLTLNGTSFSLNSTITGALVRFNTVSGSTVYAKNGLSTSGTLVTESGAYFDGNTMVIQSGNNRVGIGTSTPGAALEVNSADARLRITDTDASGQVGLSFYNVANEVGAVLIDTNTNTLTLEARASGGASVGGSITMLNTGNVGIDTVTPGARLSVSGSVAIGQGLGSRGAKAQLDVVGSISGATLYVSNSMSGAGLTDCDLSTQKLTWDSTTERFGCSTLDAAPEVGTSSFTGAVLRIADDRYINDNGDTMTGALQIIVTNGLRNTIGLNVVNAISGAVIRAQNTLASSGTLVWEGAASGSSLWVSTFEGAGLTDCDATGQTLNWDATTGRFVCGADESAASGMDQNAADMRYVRKAGDTMTGVLVIDVLGGNRNTVGLNVINTISGAVVHGRLGLTSSGTLSIESGATINGAVSIRNGKDINLIAEPGATRTDPGDIVFLTNWGGQKGRIWTEPNAGSGLYLSSTDNTPDLAVSASGFVGIRTTTPDAELEVIGTVSGSVIRTNSLNSSGTLVVEGAMSGASLYVASSINGAGLTDCDAVSSKLLWDASTGRFSCGTISSSGASTGNILTIGDDRYVRTSGDTMTGALTINITDGNNNTVGLNVLNTVSGAIVRAQKSLVSSGTLLVESTATFQGSIAMSVLNTISAAGGVGTNTITLYNVSGNIALSPTDAGSDSVIVQGGLGIGNSALNSPANGLSVQGNTILGVNGVAPGSRLSVSGAIIVNPNGNLGTTGADAGLALEIIGTASGRVIRAQNTLTSSGTLVFEGAASGSSLYIATSINGAGLTDCDAASSRLLWDETTGRFSCSTIAGAADVIAVGDSRYVRIAGATMTGSLIIRSTSGSNALGLNVAGGMSGVSLNISGTGAQPLLRTNTQYGMILMGTGSMRTGTGHMMPQLGIAAREPRLISQITPTAAADNLALQGRYMYVTSTNLQSIDVSNSTKPTAIGSVSTSTTNPTSIALQGKTAFLAVSTVIQAFDISNPAVMIPLSTFTPSSSPGALAAQGRYVFTLNTTAQRLQVIDTQDPKRMVSVSATAVTGNTPNAIAVQGRYAYITNGGGGTMQIFDLQNLAAPVSLGTTSAGTTPNGIAVQGRYAYVINTTGMQIFDVSNPASVVTLGSVSGSAQGAIAVQGRYAYVVGANGFQTIDISDPESPYIVSNIATGTALTDIVVQGRYAYVANNGGTRVNIYDLGGLYATQAEFGSLEVSVLSVRQNLYALDASLNGNVAVGASLMVSGNASFGTGGLFTVGGNNAFAVSIKGTASGNVLHAEKLITSSGSMLATGVIASRTALSGAALNVMTGNSYILGNTMIGSAGNADTKLEVLGTISGSSIYARTSLRSSGSLVWEGSASGAALWVSAFSGAGLTDCDLSTQKLQWDITTDRFSCGTITAAPEVGTLSFTGAVLTIGNDRYVNDNGDTMTGTLVIDLTSGFVGLNVKQTISGATVYASRSLMSSGTLVVENQIARGSGALTVIQQAEFGTGAYISGSGGALLALDSLGIGKQTPHIAFGYAGAFDTNLYRSGISILKTDGSFFASATISGAVVRANTLASSGSLVFEGSASGSSLWVSTFSGAGLTDCDLTTSKVIYDSTTERFSCGTVNAAAEVGTASFSGAVLRIGDNRWVKKQGDTMTGSLVIDLISGTVGLEVIEIASGSTVYASRSLMSSGTLVVESQIARGSGALTVIQQAEFATGAYIYSSGSVLALDAYSSTGFNKHILFGYNGNFDTNLYRSGISILKTDGSFFASATISGAVVRANTLASSGSLVFEGSASGSSLWVSTFSGAGLTDCDLSTQKLQWDITTDRFSCGTITAATPEVGTLSFTGAVLTISNDRYVNDNGDTMTGALVIDLTAGFVGLNVKQTISGATVYASRSLMSSGTLVVESQIARGSGALTVIQQAEFATGAYIYSSGSVLALDAYSSTGFNKHILFGYRGIFDTNLYRAGIGILKTDGSLFVSGTVSGSIINAKNTLASSGSLVFEGSASGSSLWVSTFSGAGLADCDLTFSKVVYDSETERFGCATDQTAGGAASAEVGTTSFSGAVFRLATPQYVNIGGDTMTGTLAIDIRNGVRSSIGLNVINTISGAVIRAQKTLASSGTLVWEGAASGSTLYVASSIQGAGLSDCDNPTSSKLLWDATTGRFSCGSDQTGGGAGAPEVGTTSFSGAVLTIGNDRFINDNGDSMTGTLSISVLNGTRNSIGLNAVNTVSGAVIHGEKSLTSSGTLVFEGAASGSTLYVASSIQGAGLSDCDNPTSSKLLWDATTGRFSCGSDQTGGGAGAPEVGTTSFSGAVFRLAHPQFVNVGGDTMTGVLAIDIRNGVRSTIGLNAINTISGAVVHGEKSLTSSGTLVWEGAGSGSSLYVASSLRGAGLTDCDLSTQKLTWDTTTGRFACTTLAVEVGTLSFTGAVMRITNDRFINDNGDTMTGTLVIDILNGDRSSVGLNVLNTISGAVIRAQKTLASSGTLVVKDDAYFQSNIMFTKSGTFMPFSPTLSGAISRTSYQIDNANSVNNSVAIGTDGMPVVSLYSSSNSLTVIRCATVDCSSVASETAVDLGSGVGQYSSIAIGADGLPVISYYDGSANANLKVVKCGNAGCTTGNTITTLDSTGTVGQYTSIAIAPDGLPAISYYDDTNDDLKMVKCGNAACSTGNTVTTVDSTNSVGQYTTIAIGTDGYPTIAYYDSSLVLPRVAKCSNASCSSSTTTTVDGPTAAGFYMTMTMGGDGNPVLAYAASSNIRLLKCGNPACTSGNIANNLDTVGSLEPIALATGRDGLPIVAYYQSAGGELETIKCGDASCSSGNTISIVDSTTFAGEFPNMTIGADGNPVIVYRANSSTIKLMRCADPSCSLASSSIYSNGNSMGAPAGNGRSYGPAFDSLSIMSIGSPGSFRNLDFTTNGVTRMSITPSGRVGVGTTSPDSFFHVDGPAVLSGSVKLLHATGTIGTSANGDGMSVQINSAGSSRNTSIIQRAALVSLGAGYTGSGRTVGLEMVNAAQGTNSNFYGLVGNFGFAGSALGTTSGANVAAFGNAQSGAINIGFFGRTTVGTPTVSRGVNIGMIGLSRNTAAKGVEIGGYFGLNNSTPTFESGALVIDNADSTSPIILGRDNGKIVFSIQDGGNMRLGSGAGITARQNIYTSNGFNNEAVIINTDETTNTQNIFRIISDVAGTNDNAFRIRADGSTFSDNAYSAAGADYAEWFYSTDSLQKGEVVCIDVTRNNAVTRCANDADSNVMGIVSTNPAFIGNTIGGADGIIPPGYALIGLIGQVPAKVMIENGEAIRPGDSLTAASVAGYARRARAGESTVGVALEGLESGEGVVNVLISRRNQSLTVEAVEQNVLKTIADMEIEDEVQIMVASTLEDLNVDSQISTEVERQLAGFQDQDLAIEAIREELNILKAQLALINSQSGATTTVITQTGSYNQASSLEVDGTLTTGGDARIGGDLHIDGTLSASSLFVPNGLSIDGGVVMNGMLDTTELRVASGAVIDGVMTVNGALVLGSGAYLNAASGALSIGELIVHDSLFVMGDITIEGLATFLGDIEVKGELIVSNKQAGFAMIPASGTSVTIYFGSGMKATPVVTATPNGPVFSPWWVSAPTQTGFTIHVASPVAADTLFSWISLSTAAPMTIVAEVLEDGSLVFPTDDAGIPVSSNMVWNACIRNVTLLDSEGQPLSCGRYHDQFTWSHPDLNISFIWNTSVTPPLLKVPDGYKVEVTESAQSIEDAFNGDEEITEEEPASSSASSEAASSSSSISSEAASSSSSISSEVTSFSSESSVSSQASSEASIASEESSAASSEETASSASSAASETTEPVEAPVE